MVGAPVLVSAGAGGEHGAFVVCELTMSRYCLIALLLCLAGCDKPENVAPAAAVAPVAVPEAPATTSVAPARDSAPVSPLERPETPVAKAQVSRAKPVSKLPSKSRATEQELAPLPLDLRLPHELVDQLEPGEPIPDIVPRPRLLPPLFGAKPVEPSAFQLSGKLITNDLDREKLESDNFLDKVDGAQLNFEFRQ